MEKYQEVDFYLTKEGWIVGDIRNQDGQNKKQADATIPSDYVLKVTEKTYEPNTTRKLDSTRISPNGSYQELMNEIKTLQEKYNGTRPYVPYLSNLLNISD